MTLDKARELISVQVSLGSGYNRNATKLILPEVQREHGTRAANQLINEFNLDSIFDLKTDTDFTR